MSAKPRILRRPGAYPVIALAAVVLVVGAAFGRAIGNGAVWDDAWLTIRNPFLGSLDGLVACVSRDLWSASALEEHSEFYRPLPMLSYALDRALGGNVPASYHVGNLLVHALAVLALGVWIQRRFRSRALAAVAALLFATLPLASEPVFWISGRFDSLGLLFVLLALGVAQQPGRGTTALVVACAVAATACKEPFVTAPLLLAVDDFILVRRPIESRIGRYAALLVAELAWLGVRRAIGVGSASTLAHVTLSTLAKSYLYLVWTFGRILVDGTRLDTFHPYAPLAPSTNIVVLGALLATTAALALWARRRWHERPARLAAAGWAWILITLVPVTVAGPTLEMVGDRYAYVPSVGLVLLAVALAAQATRRRAPIGIAAVSLVVTMLVVGGIHRCRLRARDWASDRTLVLSSLRNDPNNAYALGELGSQYAMEHDWSNAEETLRRAIELPQQTTWRARTALCFVYLNVNRLEEAAAQCRTSLESNPENPRAWLNLATVETRQKRWAQALQDADTALLHRPRYAEAHFVRALALANLGRRDEARTAADTALGIDPAHQGARTLATHLGRGASQAPSPNTLPSP